MLVDDRMDGYPPDPDSLVTLANWQDPPNQRWAFRHMRELLPSHVIRTTKDGVRTLPESPASVGGLAVQRLDGSESTVAEVMDDSWTDALVVLHDGAVAVEQYWAGMTTSTRHLLMSVTKSVVGCVTGILVGEGVIDPAAQVTTYVPEVGDSGYGGATVRDLLDMRTGVAFREEYTELDAEVRVMERSMGWRPIESGDPVGAYNYLTTLGTAGPHGGQFTYRSADTDMLGWVCERASGRRMANLISELVWGPIGAAYDAEITCDAVGTAIHDGGMSATARDLARFGQLLLDDGGVDGRQVVPAEWLAEARTVTPALREAFRSSSNEPYLPGGWYHDQFWFIPGAASPVLLCLGIHGQLVYVNRDARVVAVKFSSWPDAQNPGYLVDTLRALGAVSTHLADPT
jgi:CubicO group peptidase (beta-lactamase class C family)